ncbi:MAG: translation initiation factor IF-2 subunit alpha [Candidatus Heimdallarchaeota archaeon]|nr:translation initiation factor IF-2 subunit alpha [Candidatus Heimdallarchaeota archaeon]
MSRRNLPESGDLVIGTVKRIFDHGVYVDLDEYEDLQAYCHVSEVSSTWVRNIRNVMRIGKKVVGRVMRIKAEQIDISIKRVSDGLKRSKVEEWKKYKTGLTLLEMAATRRKINLETARSEVEDLLTDFHGSLFNAFEEALFRGEIAFTEAEVSEEWASTLTSIAKKNLTIPKVEITRDLEIICWESNGITLIKNALQEAEKARSDIEAEDAELSMDVFVRGAPMYRFKIHARDYELAEGLMSRVVETVETYLTDYKASVKVVEVKS